ncbi:MAG: gliding motility-associated C-terminal domain-containing protein [Bacteroidota bacterium]
MKLLRTIFSIAIGLGAYGVSAQMINMGDPGHPLSNPANCNSIGVSGNNFQDHGGAGDYTANYNGTITFCPDLTTGTKMSITMAINAGFTFDVHGSDFIYVYDGPDDTYPLLGTHNSVTNPTGFTHQATWNNTSGCLTIKFVTDGANQGSGWLANVQCGNPNQPFTPHLKAYVNGTGPDAINPADTGFVDVCFGDSIMFVASGDFPYSQETTGYGYSQDVDVNIEFDWTVTDGGNYPANDTIWFTPPARAGYLVDVKMTDQFPQIERLRCKVRVSQLPSFAGTGPIDDVICLGESTELLGGVTSTDTVGVAVPPGTFNLGGNFAGLTYLPDGSGQQYTAPIQIGGFPDGATVDDVQDLNQVCITMEHSYLGDLEIWLECPNGTIVPLVNSYSPGFITGGNSGGGTFLGQPFDDSGGGGAGIGWEYCFSSVFNTINGSMTQNLGNTVTVPGVPGSPPLTAGNSIDSADIYQPEATFANFSGCPVNGQWTIHVQDNLGIDDGWIFEWGLYFDASYFPGMGSYQTYITNDFWDNDPTIVGGMNDTLIVVQPSQAGSYNYTFNVIDNFGCPYDTTVTLTVQPLPEIFDDTIVCGTSFQVSGTSSVAGGVWSSTSPEVTFNPTSANDNPLITATTTGSYTVTYTDTECNHAVSAEITFPPPVDVNVIDTTVCIGTPLTITALAENATTTIWNNGGQGSTIQVTPMNTVNDYIVTAANLCYSETDTCTINTYICDITVPNIMVLSSQAGNNAFFVQYDGITEFNCVITNRWGNVIYEYNDPAGQWNGKTQDGKDVEEGTYFYIIRATFGSGEEVTKHGFVQVVY